MAGEICCQVDVHHVTKSFPSPGVSFLQPPPHGPDVSRISDTNAPDGPFKNYTRNEQSTSKHLKDIHMKDETYYVITLIIPKQETTSNSCQAINEEDIYAIQNEESLLPIGWIHVMVPEAVGIVLVPTDESRKYGIFRLSDPDGMNIIKDCRERGFHLHKEADGIPVYEDCSNIIFNPKSEAGNTRLALTHRANLGGGGGPYRRKLIFVQHEKSSPCACTVRFVYTMLVDKRITNLDLVFTPWPLSSWEAKCCAC